MREAIVIAGAALAFAGATAAAPGLLAGLERGAWRITPRDGSPVRTVCLGNPARLAQLAHPRPACPIAAVEEGAGRVTLQYVCRSRGYGRTTIRQETPTLVQIDTQGVARGLPFQFSAEARRIGACR